MELKDFTKITDEITGSSVYISKEKFLYDDGKIKFSYRYLMCHWTYQPGWDSRHDTEFYSYIVVDEDSIHESHKKDGLKKITDSLYLRYYGFHLKTKTKSYCKTPSENDYEIIAERIDRHRIDSKIKKDKYKRIKDIVNGYDS